MNEQRKLINWSPHAANGPSSPHAQEFVVCSSSLRLFRASTQLPAAAAAGGSATGPQPLSRQLSVDSSSDARTNKQWGVTVRAHSDYDAQEVLPRSSFDLLDTFTYPGQVFRCLDWSHHASRPYMVGGGQASGKLVVVNFDVPGSGGGSMTTSGGDGGGGGGGSDSSASRIVKEFQPRYARACHVVCWNPLQSNQVAVGLDRVRNGCGTLIWDVTQQGSTGGSGAGGGGGATSVTPAPSAAHHYSAFVQQGSAGGNNILNTNSLSTRGSSTGATGAGAAGGGASAAAPIETVTEPLGRVSNSEATLSLNWLPGDPFSLAVGTGFKWLRIYDIRGNARPISVVAHAKSVNGVRFDPFNPHRLATFTDEGTAKIWDLRMLTRREIFQIHTGASATPSAAVGSSSSKPPAPKQLVEVEWCPTAPHRIATIHRDDDGFRLWDLSGCVPAMVHASLGLPMSPNGAGAGGFSDGEGGGNGDSFDAAQKLAAVPSALDVVGAAPASGEQVESAPFRHVKLACLTNAFQSGGGGGGMAGGAGQGGAGSGGGVGGGSSGGGGAGIPAGGASLSSLSWHPLHRQRLLLVTSHGLVEDLSVRDGVPLQFGAGDHAPAFAVDQHLFVGARAPETGLQQHQQSKDAPLALLAAPTAQAAAHAAPSGNSLSPPLYPATSPSSPSSAAAASSTTSTTPDPMLFLSQDISARMRVRALLGYGLDPATNERVAQKVAAALRASIGTGATVAANGTGTHLRARPSAREIERSLLEEGVADEQTLVRVWEWMVQSERLHSMQKQQQPFAHSPSSSGSSSAPQQGRGRFTGILSLLLPSLTAESLASMERAAASGGVAQSTPVPTLTTPTGATTLLSLLKNEGSSSSATTTPISSPSHASTSAPGSGGGSLSLSPASVAVESSAAQGYLPSGFKVYISPQRSEALKLCAGWFDIFKLDRTPAGGAPQLQHAAARPAALSSSSTSGAGPMPHPSSYPSIQHYMYESHIRGLEAEARYEKAALVAIMHLDLERALHSLTMGAQRKRQQQMQQAAQAQGQGQGQGQLPSQAASAAGEEGTRDLGLVAMALSGYANFAFHSGAAGGDGGSGNSDGAGAGPPPALHQLWNQTWAAALGAGTGATAGGAGLSSPLKAIFSFLSTFAPRSPTASTYSALLDEPSGGSGGGGGLELQDKLGFMLRFLPDSEMLRGMMRLTRRLLDRGSLDAVVLTGLNHAQVVAPMAPGSASALASVATPAPASSPSSATAAATGAAVSVVTAPPSAPVCVNFTMELLQSYVDRTADIQTAAILGCFAGVSINFAGIAAAMAAASTTSHAASASSPSGSAGSVAPSPSAGASGGVAALSSSATPFGDCSDPSIALSHFIYFYKQLLNQWQLWGERARFDVARALLEKSWTEEEQARLAAVAQHHQQQYGPGSGTNRGASGGALQLRKPSHHTQVRPHISARCNFCGQSLSLEAMSGGAAAGAGGAGGPGHPAAGGGAGGRTAAFRPRGRVGAARGVPDHNSARIRGCPNCRKALPRCALCLVSFDCDTPHLPGSGAPPSRLRKRLQQSSDRGSGGVGGSGEDDSSAVSGGPSSQQSLEDDARFDQSSMHDFAKWFTWCQACRHGGHADHMADWFGQHGECPVTDCRCRCMSLDLLPCDGSGGSGGGPAVHPIEEQGESPVEAQLRANEALAAQQAQFLEQQAAAANAAQQQQQQQQGLLLSQQLAMGLPAVDAVTLAQAIRLIQMSRTPSTAAQGQMVPAGLDLGFGLAQLHFSPSASPPPPPHGHGHSLSHGHSQQHTPAGTNPTTTPIHHAASSPYLQGVDASSTPSYAPQQHHQQQQTTPQQAPQSNPVLPRPGSQLTLTGRSVTAGPSPARGNFPLTRW